MTAEPQMSWVDISPVSQPPSSKFHNLVVQLLSGDDLAESHPIHLFQGRANDVWWDIEALQLGKDGCTKSDYFSEKFQTAFEPQPLIFGKLYCKFFIMDMVTYIYARRYEGHIVWNEYRQKARNCKKKWLRNKTAYVLAKRFLFKFLTFGEPGWAPRFLQI